MKPEKRTYIVFQLAQMKYAVLAEAVKEIVRVPYLNHIAQVPHFVVGAFNLRGNIVFVIDLARRMNIPQKVVYFEQDIIIVIQAGNRLVGILANEIGDIVDITSKNMEKCTDMDNNLGNPTLLSSMATIDENLIMIIDIDNLLMENDSKQAMPLPVAEPFSLSLSSNDRVIVEQRTKKLVQSQQAAKSWELLTLCVVGIRGEFFAIELVFIVEFSRLKLLTPVPCTPAHIAGNMNLRGEVITIVDISDFLKIPKNNHNNDEGQKTAIISAKDTLVGFLIDDVYDIINLSVNDISKEQGSSSNVVSHYIKSTISYGQNTIGIIDVERFFIEEVLVVNDSV